MCKDENLESLETPTKGHEVPIFQYQALTVCRQEKLQMGKSPKRTSLRAIWDRQGHLSRGERQKLPCTPVSGTAVGLEIGTALPPAWIRGSPAGAPGESGTSLCLESARSGCRVLLPREGAERKN
jgi:hypothetical protein